MKNFFEVDKDLESVRIFVKVKTNAKINKLIGVSQIENRKYLNLSISENPEENRANIAIIKFLSKKLKVKQNDISIISGVKNNKKVILIKNFTLEGLNFYLLNYI